MSKKRYNSDFMSREIDDRLEQLEEKLTAVYANASNEARATLTDFLKTFEEEDQKQRLLVESGQLSDQDYLIWRRNTIIQSGRYKATIDALTDMLVNTDIAAMAIVDNELPLVIAQSYNFVKSLGFKAAEEAGISAGTFSVYNARTVQALIRDNPKLLPASRVNIPADTRWNRDRMNTQITRSILKGDSISKTADRLQEVTNMDRNAAIRNARTSVTAAENLGRSEAADAIEAEGVPIIEEWSATYDNRTRDSHLLMDGTTRDENGYFGAGIIATPLRFPGDPDGDPEEIYNCRCRLSIKLGKIDHTQDGDLYRQFMEKNHPEDYEALKESASEIRRKDQEEAAKVRQEELRRK